MTRQALALSLLEEAGSRGVTTAEFMDAGVGSRYSARLLELRKAGHRITSERVREGSWKYVLLSEEEGPNPGGLCQCGCGGRTVIAACSSELRGHVKGKPVRYIFGHQLRKSPVEYIKNKETGCWDWQRGKSKGGYGICQGPDGKKGYAHRFYFQRAKGPIPEGMQIDHLCRNRGCVNPDHMEVVTNRENVRRGLSTKLTADQVRTIRTSSEPLKVLAARYGVAVSTVKSLRSGSNWDDVLDVEVPVQTYASDADLTPESLKLFESAA